MSSLLLTTPANDRLPVLKMAGRTTAAPRMEVAATRMPGQALRPAKELAGKLAHYAAHSPVIPGPVILGGIIVVQAGIGLVESILPGEKVLLAVVHSEGIVLGITGARPVPGITGEPTVLGKPGPAVASIRPVAVVQVTIIGPVTLSGR